jgi:hypothetical protein
MRLYYLFLFGTFPSFALSHAGETHDFQIGCPNSIFAGPVFNDVFYYTDFGSRKIIFYNISRKEKVQNWQLEEGDYILLAPNPRKAKNVLVFSVHGYNLSLAELNDTTNTLIFQNIDSSCGLALKARQFEEKLFLLDLTSGQISIFEKNKTCTPAFNSSIKTKLGQMIKGYGKNQDYLTVWSFAVTESHFYFLGCTTNVSKSFRDIVTIISMHRTSFDLKDLGLDLMQNIDEENLPVFHGYGDIFYKNSTNSLFLINGEGYMIEAKDENTIKQFSEMSKQSQSGKIFNGKLLQIPIEDPMKLKVCGVGFRHPYMNFFDGNKFLVADVGESSREKIVFADSTCAHTENFLWPVFEGTLLHRPWIELYEPSVKVFPTLEEYHCIKWIDTNYPPLLSLCGVSIFSTILFFWLLKKDLITITIWNTLSVVFVISFIFIPDVAVLNINQTTYRINFFYYMENNNFHFYRFHNYIDPFFLSLTTIFLLLFFLGIAFGNKRYIYITSLCFITLSGILAIIYIVFFLNSHWEKIRSNLFLLWFAILFYIISIKNLSPQNYEQLKNQRGV